MHFTLENEKADAPLEEVGELKKVAMTGVFIKNESIIKRTKVRSATVTVTGASYKNL